MELRRLRYFVAVAEELNVSRAAERLRIAQPALSTQIKHLELDLGVRLFDRTSRGVLLTDAGRSLLGDARRVIPQLDHAVEMARSAGSGHADRLTVGFIPSATNLALPRMLRSFTERRPDVALFLREMPSPAVLRGLLDGDLDVGLTYLPLQDHEIESEVVQPERIVLAVPDFHHLARRSEVALSDVADETLILPDRDHVSGLHDTVLDACRAAGFEPRAARNDVWLQQTMLGLVAGGVGVALVPDSATHLQRRGVVFVPLSGAGVGVELGIAWRRGSLSSTGREFAHAR